MTHQGRARKPGYCHHAVRLPGEGMQAPKRTEPLWRRRVPGSPGEAVPPCQGAGYMCGSPGTAALVADGQAEPSWLSYSLGADTRVKTSPSGEHKKAGFKKNLAHSETHFRESGLPLQSPGKADGRKKIRLPGQCPREPSAIVSVQKRGRLEAKKHLKYTISQEKQGRL